MKVLALQAVGASLRYHDLPGEGRPLLFVHGLGCASSCDFPLVADAPGLRQRRRILVDLLGSGFSDRPSDFAYTVAAHAATVVALCDNLGIPELDVFGHSMGGAVAIEVARLLSARVRHLMLGEPNLDAGGGVFSRAVASMTEADYVARGHVRIMAQASESAGGIWAASMRASAPYAVHRAAVSLLAGGTPSWRETLLTLPMPRCVIFGAASLPDPDVAALASSGIRTEVLADAGHSMAWENPQGLAGLLAAFTNEGSSH